MEFRIEVSCVDDDGIEHRHDLLSVYRTEMSMTSLGMTLDEGKALLGGLQGYMVEQQAVSWLARHRSCPHCGRRYVCKGSGHRTVSTVYGQVAVPSPRWRCCPC